MEGATASRVPPALPRTPSEAQTALPPELERFLKQIDSPSILIRGPPGGGKTALALRLLSRTRGPTIWVSTRSAGSRNAPRLLSAPGIRGEGVRWVDLSVGGSDSVGVGPRVAEARRCLVELGHEPERVDEGAAWLAPGLREAWVERSGQSDLSVAIDSWEGLIDLYLDSDPEPPVASELVERLLVGRLVRHGVRLLIISERNLEGPLDYEVDAVLQIAHGELEERSIRVLTMPKLKGVTRDESIYPFTLEEGSFTYLPRALHSGEYVRFRCEDPPMAPIAGIWPGSRDFSGAFGGLPVGGFSVIEREDAVPSEITRKLTATMALSCLKMGGRVLLVLPPGVPPEAVVARFRNSEASDRIASSLRILGVPVSDRPSAEVRQALIPLKGSAPDEIGFLPVGEGAQEEPLRPIFPEATEFLLQSSSDKHPALAIVDIPGWSQAAAMAGREPSPELLVATLRRGSRGNPVHGVLTSVAGEPLLEPLRPMAQPYVRLVARRGRIFALGYLPWTPAYAVQSESDPTGDAPYRLLRMS